MASWTIAQKRAAARIFAQALPSLNIQKPRIKSPIIENSQCWESARSQSPDRSVSSNNPQSDVNTSESEFSKDFGTTSDEVLFVLRFAVCVLLMSCMF